jgi:hypothetical protein
MRKMIVTRGRPCAPRSGAAKASGGSASGSAIRRLDQQRRRARLKALLRREASRATRARARAAVVLQDRHRDADRVRQQAKSRLNARSRASRILQRWPGDAQRRGDSPRRRRLELEDRARARATTAPSRWLACVSACSEHALQRLRARLHRGHSALHHHHARLHRHASECICPTCVCIHSTCASWTCLSDGVARASHLDQHRIDLVRIRPISVCAYATVACALQILVLRVPKLLRQAARDRSGPGRAPRDTARAR